MATCTVSLKESTPERVTISLVGHLDSNNFREVQHEVLALREANPQGGLTINMEGVQSISSAGLRMFLELRRREESLIVEDLSPEVYGLFEATGFTNLMTTRQKLREMSVDGMETIGRSNNGDLLRDETGRVVKLYDSGSSYERVRWENVNARVAANAGLPVAEAVDTVIVGDRFANVYELGELKTIDQVLEEDPSRAGELGYDFGTLIREIHGTPVAKGDLPRAARAAGEWVDRLEERLLAHGDAELVREVVGAIPIRETMLNFRIGNGDIMVNDGELVVVDSENMYVGNPLYELMTHENLRRRTTGEPLVGLDAKGNVSPLVRQRMRQAKLEAYFGNEKSNIIKRHLVAMQRLSPLAVMLLAGRLMGIQGSAPDYATRLANDVVEIFRFKAPEMAAVASTYK